MYMLEGMGVRHDVDLGKLIQASDLACSLVGGRKAASKAANALATARESGSEGLRRLVGV